MKRVLILGILIAGSIMADDYSASCTVSEYGDTVSVSCSDSSGIGYHYSKEELEDKKLALEVLKRKDLRWKDANQAYYSSHGLGSNGLPVSATNPLAISPSADQIKLHAEPKKEKLIPTAECGPVCTEVRQGIEDKIAESKER